MAEFIFKDIVSKNGRQKEYYISSAATHTDEIFAGRGNPIYPPAREQLLRHKIVFDEGKQAVLIKSQDYEEYDLFICMDNENLRSLNRIFNGDKDRKVHLLLEPFGFSEVSDPWYTRDFSLAFDDILKGCEALFERIEKEKF